MKYQRKADIVARSVAGENVLIPVQGCTSSVYTLNDTGCLLWDLLEQPRTADELADALVAHYRIAQDAAGQDVAVYLGDLMRMGLIEVAEEAIAFV